MRSAMALVLVLAGAVGLPIWRRTHRGRPGHEPEDLQAFALEVLRTRHPDWKASARADGAIDLRMGAETSAVFELDDVLRAAAAGADRGEVAEIIQLKASELLKAAGSLSAGRARALESVRARLRPALVPRAMVEDNALAARPFAGDVWEALVVDEERHVSYVLREDVSRWQVSQQELHDAATAALWEASRHLTVEAQRPAERGKPGRYVILHERDSYDAARLLCPGLRDALGNELGRPFFVGIPNRYFLVAWSADFAFASEFADQVSRDFATRDHPISPKVFLVDGNAVTIVP